MNNIVKVLAKDWKLDVYDSGWVPVKGVETFGFTGDKEDAETTTFDSDGWDEHLVSFRSRAMTFEGLYLENKLNGERDPGQARIDELADKFSHDGFGDFRLTSPFGNVKVFKGSVNIGEMGGDKKEATKWGGEITVSGPVYKELSSGLESLAGIEEEAEASLTFVPTFDNEVHEYNVTVNSASTWIKLTPNDDGSGVITVNDAVVASGVESNQISIASGKTTPVYVTQHDDEKSPVTYTINVSRPA